MPNPIAAAPTSRGKILDVSEALFARKGFSGVGMREVADAVGLGKSSLFHHFPTKGQLYHEVLERQLSRIHDHLAPALRGPGDALARLEAWVEALVDALAEQPISARLLLRGLFEDHDLPDAAAEAARAERVLARIIAQAEDLLREGVASGVLRRVSVPDTLQTLIGASVYHFASGEIGERLLGGTLFSASAVRRRKRELRALIHQGLAANPEEGTWGS